MNLDSEKIKKLLKDFLIDTIIETNLINQTYLFGLPLYHYDTFCQFIDQIYMDNEDIAQEMIESDKIYDFFRSWYKIINSFLKVSMDKYKLIEFNKEITEELFNIYFGILYPNCIR
jgi:predicted metallo-beta-lactamase superfamily hydrolase